MLKTVKLGEAWQTRDSCVIDFEILKTVGMACLNGYASVSSSSKFRSSVHFGEILGFIKTPP